MTDIEINAEMAKAAGIVVEPDGQHCRSWKPFYGSWQLLPECGSPQYYGPIPDYIRDWNAVHEVVNELEQQDRFIFEGMIELTHSYWTKATQRDWCEAYLRVRGMWKEETT